MNKYIVILLLIIASLFIMSLLYIATIKTEPCRKDDDEMFVRSRYSPITNVTVGNLTFYYNDELQVYIHSIRDTLFFAVIKDDLNPYIAYRVMNSIYHEDALFFRIYAKHSDHKVRTYEGVYYVTTSYKNGFVHLTINYKQYDN